MAAFKLTKAQQRSLDTLVTDAQSAANAVTAALDVYNTQQDALKQALNEIVEDWQATWNEHSERWQEGDSGQAATAVIEAWEEFRDNFDEIEVDLPDLTLPEAN